MIFLSYSMTHIFLSSDYCASSPFPSWNALILNLKCVWKMPCIPVHVCAHTVHEYVHKHLLSVCVHVCVLHTYSTVSITFQRWEFVDYNGESHGVKGEHQCGMKQDWKEPERLLWGMKWKCVLNVGVDWDSRQGMVHTRVTSARSPKLKYKIGDAHKAYKRENGQKTLFTVYIFCCLFIW